MWLTLLNWFISLFQNKGSLPTPPNAATQNQSAGRDAYQAGRDLVINPPRLEQKVSPPPPEQTVSGKTLGDLIITNESAESLSGMVKAVTGIRAEGLTAPFIGRWLKVDGVIANVSSSTADKERLLVSAELKKNTFYPLISMWFSEPKSRAYLTMKNKGDAISAIGKIEEIGPYRIYLEDCELLSS